MKKIALLIILSYSLQLTSQTSDLIPVLLKEAEKVCETGDYKKFIKYSEELGDSKKNMINTFYLLIPLIRI